MSSLSLLAAAAHCDQGGSAEHHGGNGRCEDSISTSTRVSCVDWQDFEPVHSTGQSKRYDTAVDTKQTDDSCC